MERLGDAAWNLGLAVMVLGALTALIFQALDELIWRALRNKRLVKQWIANRRDRFAKSVEESEERDLADVEKLERELIRNAMAGQETAFYNLHYTQLCAQTSTSIQVAMEQDSESDLVRVTAIPPKAPLTPRIPKEIDEEARLFFLDRSIDELQVTMRIAWTRHIYGTSVVISSGLTVLLWLYAQTITERVLGIPLYVVVAIAAGLLAPNLNRLIEQRFS